MSTTIRCPGCQSPLQLSQEHLGRTLRCPACSQVFTAPAPQPQPAQNVNPPFPPVSQPPVPPAPPPSQPMPQQQPTSHSSRIPPGYEETEVYFDAKVIRDADGILRGKVKVEIAPNGMYVNPGEPNEELFPRGIEARKQKDNQLRVEVGERYVVLEIQGSRTYQKRLAKDAAAYLRGDRDGMSNDYVIPVGLFILAGLPIGIPIITLGGAIPAGVGAGLTSLNFGILKNESMDMTTRVMSIIGLNVLGYGVLIALLMAILG